MTGRRLGLVVNPTAGSGRAAAHSTPLLAALRARGHDVTDLSAADPEQASARAHAAVRAGLDALVVAGGDGMVNLGANAVAGTEVPLGLIAVGSGNDVARTLGLPRHDVGAALAVLDRALEEGARAVDAVRVRSADAEAWYLGVLSAGFDAAVNARANTLRRPRGTGRYLRALVTELRTFRPYGYRVTLDDGTWASRGTLVAVANGTSFGGGMRIAPDARVDDGLLDVVLAGPLTRSGVVALLPRVYRGTHGRHPACQTRRSRTVLLEAASTGAPPPPTFADGEPFPALPLRLDVVPGAVRVLAPRGGA